MATVDDAIRDAYKARAERIEAIRDRAEDLASLPSMREVEILATLIAQLAAEVQ